MTLLEAGKVLFGVEEGFEPGKTGGIQLRLLARQYPFELTQRPVALVLLVPIQLCSEQRTEGRIEMGVLWFDGGVSVQVQSVPETLDQSGDELHGSAQEHHVTLDGTPAGQAAQGLTDHGVQGAGGDVCLGCPFVQERAHIGLGEDRTATGNGIDAACA